LNEQPGATNPGLFRASKEGVPNWTDGGDRCVRVDIREQQEGAGKMGKGFRSYSATDCAKNSL
jgi:hypothetical protein